MSEHTPTPWELVEATAHHGAYVVNEWGSTVADLYAMSNPLVASIRNGGTSFPVPFDNADANAAFIVKAVNLHDELVAALKGYIDLIRSDYEGRGGKINSSFAEEYDKLNVLLARADPAEKTP